MRQLTRRYLSEDLRFARSVTRPDLSAAPTASSPAPTSGGMRPAIDRILPAARTQIGFVLVPAEGPSAGNVGKKAGKEVALLPGLWRGLPVHNAKLLTFACNAAEVRLLSDLVLICPVHVPPRAASHQQRPAPTD